MGILDEAIREHLELKRQHGAAEGELQELEKDAFGPAERPGAEEPSDQLSEAPTEFMVGPEQSDSTGEEPVDEPSAREEAAARIAGLQEPPESRVEPPPEPSDRPEPPAPEAPEEPEAPAPEAPDRPEAEADTGSDAGEPSASGPSTEERQVIGEQPTEHFDVVGAGEAESDEGGAESEAEEPQQEPKAAGAEEVEDDFFDEQRLSEELDQALEGPSDAAPEVATPDDVAPPSTEGKEGKDEDVLEETPEFLEESPEDDELWFEQKPPKDFDFDD